jgi:hypothetical protein
VGLIIFYRIFVCIPYIQSECGKYLGIFYGILLVPHNTLMDLNSIMNECIGSSIAPNPKICSPPSVPKCLSCLPVFFVPKMIVQCICPPRNLRLKVKLFCVKLSLSSGLSTLQLPEAFRSSSCLFFNFKSHTYNYSVNN